MISQEIGMILKPLQKVPNNAGNLGKIIVATAFEWLPKVQNIAQFGQTALLQLSHSATPISLSLSHLFSIFPHFHHCTSTLASLEAVKASKIINSLWRRCRRRWRRCEQKRGLSVFESILIENNFDEDLVGTHLNDEATFCSNNNNNGCNVRLSKESESDSFEDWLKCKETLVNWKVILILLYQCTTVFIFVVGMPYNWSLRLPPSGQSYKALYDRNLRL